MRVPRCLVAFGNETSTSRRFTSVYTSAEGIDRPLKQIVSSQLDVDRMDYLIRDSHFAGIAVGRFDVNLPDPFAGGHPARRGWAGNSRY